MEKKKKHKKRSMVGGERKTASVCGYCNSANWKSTLGSSEIIGKCCSGMVRSVGEEATIEGFYVQRGGARGARVVLGGRRDCLEISWVKGWEQHRLGNWKLDSHISREKKKPVVTPKKGEFLRKVRFERPGASKSQTSRPTSSPEQPKGEPLGRHETRKRKNT